MDYIIDGSHRFLQSFAVAVPFNCEMYWLFGVVEIHSLFFDAFVRIFSYNVCLFGILVLQSQVVEFESARSHFLKPITRMTTA